MHYIADMYHRFGVPANSQLHTKTEADFFGKSEYVNHTTRRHIPVGREVKVVIFTTTIMGVRTVKSRNREPSDARAEDF
jgi:hypothetical protein